MDGNEEEGSLLMSDITTSWGRSLKDFSLPLFPTLWWVSSWQDQMHSGCDGVTWNVVSHLENDCVKLLLDSSSECLS